MKRLITLLVCLVFLLILEDHAHAQRSGSGQFAGPGVCSDVVSPIANQSYCFDWTSGALFVWNGSAWIQISGSNNVGNFTANGININPPGSYYLGGVNMFRTGSFTPVLHCLGGDPAINTSAIVGNWWTSGNTLFYYVQAYWSTVSGGSGGGYVSGLPFPAVRTTGGQGGMAQQVVSTNSSSSQPGSENRLVGTIYQGESIVRLYEGATFGGDYLFPVPCANAWANTPSGIFITGWYAYQ